MFLLLLGTAHALTPYDSLLGTDATSAADEYAIGNEYIATQLWYARAWKDPTAQARVERIVRRVVAASDRPDFVVNVTLLDTPEVNAAALPGGFLLVNRGLIEMMTDDELAFVLGHEVAHAILRHGASALRVKEATATVAALKAARVAEDRATAQARAEDLYMMVAAHSRQLELDADLYGLVYAVRAGYPSGAADTALKKVSEALGEVTLESERAWASHPLTADRIVQLEKGRQGMEKVIGEFDAGLGFIDAGRPGQAVTSFQQFLSLFPQSEAGWTNLAAAWMLQDPVPATGPVDVVPLHRQSGVKMRGDVVLQERVADALGHALQIDPNDPVALALSGALARRQGKLPEARALLERGLVASPKDAALLTNLGNVAADEGKAAEATERWTAARAADPGRPEAQVNLARALEAANKKKEAVAAWEVLLPDRVWGLTARARMEALGTKPPAPSVPPPAPGMRTVLVDGKALSVGMDVEALRGLLGKEDQVHGAPEESFRFLVWTGPGVKVLEVSGRVEAWLLRPPTTAAPGEGLAFGQSEEQLAAALGKPEYRYAIGSRVSMAWYSKGVSVTLLDGGMREIVLSRPRPVGGG